MIFRTFSQFAVEVIVAPELISQWVVHVSDVEALLRFSFWYDFHDGGLNCSVFYPVSLDRSGLLE